jgi:pseudaminic acid synthase
MMAGTIKINSRQISPGHPVYIVAEMSANHNHDFDQAVKIIEAAKEAGADAIKLQTYTPDTLTIDCNNKYFKVEGTIWEGRNLYDLYRQAYMPWEWQPKLKEVADNLSIDLFSTPFDRTAVDFLEKINVPAYKVASFEIVDLPLIRMVAQTGRPIIMSTGMANLAEIDDAVGIIRETGNDQIALLKCTSAYPARAEEMNLRTIPHLSETFNVPVGLSDHTIGTTVPVTAVALGACIVEKHFTLSRETPGPDTAFSLEPQEFKVMVEAIRTTEKAIGDIDYTAGKEESKSLKFRRSLFAVEDIKAGDEFTNQNVRSIRPGHGLSPKYYEEILKKRASKDIERGTPLSRDLFKGGK